MQKVLQSLATAITSSATTSWFQGLGGRVYLNEAPANAQLPLCVYGVASHEISQVFDTSVCGNERFRFEFTEYHPHSSGASIAVLSAEALFSVLDNLELKPTGYDRVVIRAESRGVPEMEDDAISVTSMFRAIGTRIDTSQVTA